MTFSYCPKGTSTEQFIDFLDSPIDEAIPIMRRPGVTNYFHAHENGFSYGGKWIFIREKMDFHRYENLLPTNGVAVISYLCFGKRSSYEEESPQ